MKRTLLNWIGGCLPVLVFTSCAAPAPARVTGVRTHRIQITLQDARSSDLVVFIHTGSLEPPIVTLADNNGYPAVTSLYARAANHHGMQGVSVSVIFAGPATGRALAVNLLQPGATGDLKVDEMK